MTDRPTILFVDDDAAILRVLERAFKSDRKRWLITFVLGGSAGLAAVLSGRFDVVVSDLEMPDVDGRQILAAAREANPSVICVLHTAAEMPAKTHASDHIVAKPSSITVLRTLLESLLARRHGD